MLAKSPILIDIPSIIETSNLILRPGQKSDGALLYQAIMESYDELSKRIRWAKKRPTLEWVQKDILQLQAKWIMREQFNFLIISNKTQEIIGSIGVYTIDWEVLKFEIGYWIKTSAVGNGYAREAANALTRFLFTYFNANRIEMQTDSDNQKSINIPLSLNFEHEATLKKSYINNSGNLVDTEIFVKFDLKNLPPLDIRYSNC